jgi:flavin reductase (DIM6/NTAB) family NADH-FMN oxidoreductase RutF
VSNAAAVSLFDKLQREIWLLTAADGSRRGGLIASFVCPASIVPALPRVIVGIARQHHTWELIEAGGTFALHLLGEDQLDLVWRFALVSGRTEDKLRELATRPGITGSPIVDGTLGWLDCRVETKLDTGDRTIYLAEVVEAQASAGGTPLTTPRVLALAPPEKRRELKQQFEHDGQVDETLIRAWREQQPMQTSSTREK